MSQQVNDLLLRYGAHKDRPIPGTPVLKEKSQKEVPREKRKLLEKSQPKTSEDLTPPPISKKILIQRAVECIDRLESAVKTPDPSSKDVQHEAQLVEVLRKVFSQVSFEKEKTEIAWNEIYGTAFLMVYFYGVFSPKAPSAKGKAPAKRVPVQAAVFLKVDSSTNKTHHVEIILDEQSLCIQTGLKYANLRGVE